MAVATDPNYPLGVTMNAGAVTEAEEADGVPSVVVADAVEYGNTGCGVFKWGVQN